MCSKFSMWLLQVYILVGKDHNSIHQQSIYCLLVEILEVVHDSTEMKFHNIYG